MIGDKVGNTACLIQLKNKQQGKTDKDMDNKQVIITKSVTDFNIAQYKHRQIDDNTFELLEYYSDYHFVHITLIGDNSIDIGIAVDTEEVQTIREQVLSCIRVDDSYISICEKLEEQFGISRWKFKKEFGQRNKQLPFDFVTSDKVEAIITKLVLEKDKPICFEQFKELLKTLG